MGPGNAVSSILPSGSLSQVPWRRQGVKKATNEIYIDINEEIDGIIEANGAPTGLKIVGKVVVDCQLSGMPDILLRFGNAGQLEDIGFHPCVRLKRWDQEKVISFVPPDGVFTLMTYVYVSFFFYITVSFFLSFKSSPSLLIHHNFLSMQGFWVFFVFSIFFKSTSSFLL